MDLHGHKIRTQNAQVKTDFIITANTILLVEKPESFSVGHEFMPKEPQMKRVLDNRNGTTNKLEHVKLKQLIERKNPMWANLVLREKVTFSNVKG